MFVLTKWYFFNIVCYPYFCFIFSGSPEPPTTGWYQGGSKRQARSQLHAVATAVLHSVITISIIHTNMMNAFFLCLCLLKLYFSASPSEAMARVEITPLGTDKRDIKRHRL